MGATYSETMKPTPSTLGVSTEERYARVEAQTRKSFLRNIVFVVR
jgi:hypothetical protein